MVQVLDVFGYHTTTKCITCYKSIRYAWYVNLRRCLPQVTTLPQNFGDNLLITNMRSIGLIPITCAKPI